MPGLFESDNQRALSDLARYRATLRSWLGSTRPMTSSSREDDLRNAAYFPLKCEDHRANSHSSALDVLFAWSIQSDFKAMAITGEFGTGKTTTCIALALRLLDLFEQNMQGVFPLYVPVNRMTRGEEPQDFLARLLAGEYSIFGESGITVERMHESTAVCVILDGLEAPEDYFTGNLVSTFIGSPSPNRGALLLSARRSPRPQEISSSPREPHEESMSIDRWVRVLPMDARDQRRYMEEVYGAGDSNSVRARKVVETLDAIQAQLDRPLLLELAMLAPRTKDGRLPSTLTDLFDSATQRLLSFDYSETGSELPPDVMGRLLSGLASRLYRYGEEEVSVEMAIQYGGLSGDGIDYEAMVAALQGCRLLRDVTGRVAFAHRSLQEFFVAKYLCAAIDSGSRAELQHFLVKEPVLSMTVELLSSNPHLDSQKETLVAWMTEELNSEWPAPQQNPKSRVASNVFSLLSRLGHPLVNLQISGIDLEGANLAGARLTGSVLVDTNLSGVDLSSANLDDAVFEHVNMRNTFIRRTSAVNAQFNNCDFWNIRWVEEPPALWSAQWIIPKQVAAVALSTGHIQLLSFDPFGSISSRENVFVDASGVLEIAVSPAADLMLASDRGGRLYCYRVLAEDAVVRLVPFWTLSGVHSGNIRRIRFTPDGKFYVTASRDGGVRVFSLDSRLPVRQHFRHQDPVMDAAWSSDGRMVASAGYDGRVYLFDVASEVADPLEAGAVGQSNTGIVRAVALSPAGNTLAGGDEEGRLTLWNVVVGTRTTVEYWKMMDLGGEIFVIKYIANDVVVVGMWSGSIIRVNLSTGEMIELCRHPEVVRAIDVGGLFDDGLLSASWDGSIIVNMEGVVEESAIDFPVVEDDNRRGSVFDGSSFIWPEGLNSRQIAQLRRFGARVLARE